MKTIELTQGQVARVSDEDYEELSKYKWYAGWFPSTRSFYAMRQTEHINGKQHTIRMHRVVLGARHGQFVDHIDHDTLNNQRDNLRFCTHSQNQQNRQHRKGSSAYKGVFWYGRYNKWQAQISCDGHQKNLGYYVDERTAALAYDAKACELFGEFAHLNFPEGGQLGV